ncbi:uncharacterized protein LOC127250704 isoform X2 [Andrographis paniculata]|uniref:uncharacterized protein LOC127250704 isoform X2 n=1 Tax=Andrographis paniculata TaxID=175694 RepID=UPI0021E79D72|nr:uncharacterized protein LOC127250704 isoform X2 [Andrographis paniculata]
MKMVEMFEFGPCEDNYQIGFIIGQGFSQLIKSRLAKDLILQNQLLPFANHHCRNHFSNPFPNPTRRSTQNTGTSSEEWLRGDSPFLEVMLLNFRKEIRELPTCAFGFNSHGLAFTLNSVPPAKCEIVAGGVGRNFVSRDLLEAHSIDDALERIYSAKISVQHSYNLIDINSRRILNVETASRNRHSVYEVGEVPFFHANMYLHLNIRQDPDKNSLSRQKRDAALETRSTPNILFIWKGSRRKE